MTKKETIWRHILHHALTKGVSVYTQKNLAHELHYSLSTVFNALKVPRKIAAVQVTGRFFRLIDAEKLLLLWATQRNLTADGVYQTYVDLPARSVEGGMPPDVIYAAFSAYRLAYAEAPADYDTVYVYSANVEAIKKRFPKHKGRTNLFVLKPDSLLASFGDTTPNVQTFVDVWNIPLWYAKDYCEALKKRMNL